MKDKIVVNSSILDNNPSGLGIYSKNLVLELNKLTTGLKVYSPVEIEGVEVKKISKYVKPEYKKKGGIIRVLWTQLVLPFKLSKEEILYHPFQYLSLLSKNKQIITIHDFIPLYYPEVAKHQNFYYKYIMPLLLKKADKVICISENTKSDLLKFYDIQEEKVRVIYNGYDEELFNKNNVKKEVLEKYKIDYPYILMVGAGYRHKNIDRAMRAFALIEGKVKEKLVIVGKDSAYIKELKALAKDLNIEEKVNFVGYVSDFDLVSFYGLSSCFLYPTLYEGFGLPILEAMASGTVVLSGDNSSLLEVAGDGAISFNSENIEEISAALEKLLFNENLREELLKISAKQIKKFSWKKTAREVYKAITE